MLFERFLSKKRKISIKHHIEYFNFRNLVQLDHPVEWFQGYTFLHRRPQDIDGMAPRAVQQRRLPGAQGETKVLSAAGLQVSCNECCCDRVSDLLLVSKNLTCWDAYTGWRVRLITSFFWQLVKVMSQFGLLILKFNFQFDVIKVSNQPDGSPCIWYVFIVN